MENAMMFAKPSGPAGVTADCVFGMVKIKKRMDLNVRVAVMARPHTKTTPAHNHFSNPLYHGHLFIA